MRHYDDRIDQLKHKPVSYPHSHKIYRVGCLLDISGRDF
jgi:hypothetical protein